MTQPNRTAKAIAAEMIAEMAALTTEAEIEDWWQAQQSGRWQALDRAAREQVDVALNRRRYSLRAAQEGKGGKGL